MRKTARRSITSLRQEGTRNKESSLFHLLVAMLLNTWVLLEPQVLELGVVSEPTKLVEAADLVFSDIKLLEVFAVLDVGQCGDAVDAENT